MNEQPLNEDRLMDQNLQAIGQHVPLPPEPSDAQRQAWKQPLPLRLVPSSGPQHGATTGGARGHPARRRYFLAGSAAAAIVVLLVCFSTPTRRSMVQAGTILNSLRQTEHHGMRLTLEDIGDKDVQFTGRLSLLCSQPFSLAQLTSEEGTSHLSPESVAMEGHVAFDENASDLPGFKAQLALTLSKSEQWVYVQCDDPAPLIQEAGPLGLLLAGSLQRGMLLELTGVLDPNEVFGAGQSQAPGHVSVNMKSDADDDATSAPAADDDATSAPATGDDAQETIAVVKDFLSGHATQEQLDLIVSKLEEVAREVHVDEVERGLFVLTARDFTAAADSDAEDAEWLPGATVQIAYRPDTGVEWATATGIGPRRGHARLEFIDATSDADRVDRQKYVKEGETMVIDVRCITKSLEALSASPAATGDEN